MFHAYRKASVIVGIVLCLFSSVFAYSGGTGEPNAPYRIATVSDWLQLKNTSSDWNKNFLMIADVNLQGVTLTPVGNYSNDDPLPDGITFTGVFDGNGHVISNIIVEIGDECTVCLFGTVGPNGQIRNLGVENVNASCYAAVGGLARENFGSIINCYSAGYVSGSGCIGGLVGNNEGSITDCYSAAEVDGGDNFSIGGLVGSNEGSITNCYSTGAVSAVWYDGGLVGWNSGNIVNCYSTGTIFGIEHTGGLVGINEGSIIKCYSTKAVDGGYFLGGLVGENMAIITDCYSTGSVSGTLFDIGGGLVAIASNGSITNCYSISQVSDSNKVGGLVGEVSGTVEFVNNFWDVNSSGTTDGVGNVGPDPADVTGKTTAEMKTLSTFTSAGWDFVDTWTIGENQTYPVLRGYSGADLNYDKTVNSIDLALFADRWLQTN